MKPMLAVKCLDVEQLRYPVLATPKFDGIRCLCISPVVLGYKEQRCIPVSRNLRAIANEFIRDNIERFCPPGLDGELIVGDTFQETSSAVMSHGGRPDTFRYYVFDFVNRFSESDRLVPYHKRLDVLSGLHLPPFCVKVLPQICDDAIGVNSYEVACLNQGYEGIMTRTPGSPYKFGRSTWKEQYLLKIKRFEDSEAEVLEVIEKMTNTNEPTQSATGHQVRSTHSEGLVPAGTMGALRVRDLKTKIEFSVGTGFDDLQRASVWAFRSTYVSSIIKYKFQPHGVKEAPRFPVFIGWRSENDL